MDEKKRISFLYQFDDNWIGGTYYIINIIKALSFLPDENKPLITVYHPFQTPLMDLRNINYPNIKYVEFSFHLGYLSTKINSYYSLFLGKPLITVKLPSSGVIENFYYRTYVINNKNLKNYYHWQPDFQDLYLPQFFTKTELRRRKAQYKRLVSEKEKIVFSSNTALMDFEKFYPENTNIKKVVRFVSFQDSNFKKLDINVLKKKFKIAGDYFILSNQFWMHKNHKLVLEAFAEILKKNPSLQLVITGKENYSNSSTQKKYIFSLKKYVADNGLEDSILFLGFIDRDEQLKLMDESLAIIQPSLFEGWSTVVEDAKFLKKCIICSNIPVHREQLPGYELFFEPTDKNELIHNVEKVLNNPNAYKINYDQKAALYQFANDFIEIFD